MRQPSLLCCGAVCGGRVRKGTTPLAWLSVGFQSLPLLRKSKSGPSRAESQVHGFVYVLGPCGSHQWNLLWGWEFLPPQQPPQIFTAIDFETLFPCTGTLGCVVCFVPQLLLSVYPHANVGPLVQQLPPPALQSSNYCFAVSPHCPRCSSLPLQQSGWLFLL